MSQLGTASRALHGRLEWRWGVNGGGVSTRINNTDLNEMQISTRPQRGGRKCQRGSAIQISTRCKSQRYLNEEGRRCQRGSTIQISTRGKSQRYLNGGKSNLNEDQRNRSQRDANLNDPSTLSTGNVNGPQRDTGRQRGISTMLRASTGTQRARGLTNLNKKSQRDAPCLVDSTSVPAC